MIRKMIAVSMLTGLAACGGSSPFDPLDDGIDSGGDGGDPEVTTDGIPEALAGNLSSITFGDDSVVVEIADLDSSPNEVVYERAASLDVQGYQAFAVQEDALDRFFVALVAESDDGSVRGGVVGDGGQFNRFFSGGFYERNGTFDAPDLGEGAGSGQVSYAGDYAGLTNIGIRSDTLPVPGGTDESIIPNQPVRVEGNIFINANFADNAVNGAIFDRVLVDTGLTLDSIILVPTAIDENGEFIGEVEFEDFTGIGTYGGIFGGEDASSVAGVVALTQFTEAFDNEEERGVFVLTQCGLDGDDALCDSVAP